MSFCGIVRFHKVKEKMKKIIISKSLVLVAFLFVALTTSSCVGTNQLQGPAGVAGLIGPQGLVGEAGQQGAAGLQGPKGDQGIPGPTGQNGARGFTGSAGPQGPSGDSSNLGTSKIPYLQFGLELLENYKSLELYEEITNANRASYVAAKIAAGYLEVSTALEFLAIIPNNNYILSSNITIPRVGFARISGFSGILDGANYEVTFINSDLTSISNGLFYQPVKATFKNLFVNIELVVVNGNSLFSSNNDLEAGFIIDPLGFLKFINVSIEMKITNKLSDSPLSLRKIGALFNEINGNRGSFYIEKSYFILFIDHTNDATDNIIDVGALAGHIDESNLVLVFDSSFETIVNSETEFKGYTNSIGGVVGTLYEGALYSYGNVAVLKIEFDIILNTGSYSDDPIESVGGLIGKFYNNSVLIADQNIIISDITLSVTTTDYDFNSITIIRQTGGAVGRVDDYSQILINDSYVNFDTTIFWEDNSVATEADTKQISLNSYGGMFGRHDDDLSQSAARRVMTRMNFHLITDASSENLSLNLALVNVGAAVGEQDDDSYTGNYTIESAFVIEFIVDQTVETEDVGDFVFVDVGKVYGNMFKGYNILDDVYAYSSIPEITGIDPSGLDYFAKAYNQTNYDKVEYRTINNQFAFKDVWNFETIWSRTQSIIGTDTGFFPVPSRAYSIYNKIMFS